MGNRMRRRTIIYASTAVLAVVALGVGQAVLDDIAVAEAQALRTRHDSKSIRSGRGRCRTIGCWARRSGSTSTPGIMSGLSTGVR